MSERGPEFLKAKVDPNFSKEKASKNNYEIATKLGCYNSLVFAVM